MSPLRTLLLATATLATLTGCAGSQREVGPHTAAGVGTGAIVGGLIGGAAGRGPGAVVAGAIIGGLVGGSIGASLDEADRQRAYYAEMEALERGRSGAPVAWRNPDSGHYGTVIPGEPYLRSGRNCREYTHTIYIDGRPQTARGVACREPDGSWRPIG